MDWKRKDSLDIPAAEHMGEPQLNAAQGIKKLSTAGI
jgi:hypothetical protein